MFGAWLGGSAAPFDLLLGTGGVRPGQRCRGGLLPNGVGRTEQVGNVLDHGSDLGSPAGKLLGRRTLAPIRSGLHDKRERFQQLTRFLVSELRFHNLVDFCGCHTPANRQHEPSAAAVKLTHDVNFAGLTCAVDHCDSHTRPYLHDSHSRPPSANLASNRIIGH